MALSPKTTAPDFELPSSAGGTVNLSRDLAGKPLVLFFYPKDFTRTCTAEMCGFRDIYSKLEEIGIALYGVSRDAVGSHRNVQSKYSLPFELLSDPSGKMIKAYNAMLPIVGLPARVTYLINPQHSIEMSVSNFFSADAHTEQVLAYVERNKLANAWGVGQGF